MFLVKTKLSLSKRSTFWILISVFCPILVAQVTAACVRLQITFFWIWASRIYWCPRWIVFSISFLCWIRIGPLGRFTVPSTILWPTSACQHPFSPWWQYPLTGKQTAWNFWLFSTAIYFCSYLNYVCFT